MTRWQICPLRFGWGNESRNSLFTERCPVPMHGPRLRARSRLGARLTRGVLPHGEALGLRRLPSSRFFAHVGRMSE